MGTDSVQTGAESRAEAARARLEDGWGWNRAERGRVQAGGWSSRKQAVHLAEQCGSQLDGCRLLGLCSETTKPEISATLFVDHFFNAVGD